MSGPFPFHHDYAGMMRPGHDQSNPFGCLRPGDRVSTQRRRGAKAVATPRRAGVAATPSSPPPNTANRLMLGPLAARAPRLPHCDEASQPLWKFLAPWRLCVKNFEVTELPQTGTSGGLMLTPGRRPACPVLRTGSSCIPPGTACKNKIALPSAVG